MKSRALRSRLPAAFAAFACSAVSLFAQIADEATAVPVHFQGLFTAISTTDPDEPAFARISPLGGSGVSAAFGESDVAGDAYTTSGGYARLRPGKSYFFQIISGSISRLRVKITPPSGHRVVINGVEHEMFDWALGDGGVLPLYGAFSVRLDDGSGAPVGQADSLRPGRVLWSVGLGNLRNGKPAGSLRLVDDGITANTFRPAGLYYDRDSGNQNGCYLGDEGEVLIVKIGGILRQVYAPAILADIQSISDHAYKIRLYPRTQVGGQDTQEAFTFSGDPLHQFVIENPAPPALTALRVTRTTNLHGALTQWTQLTRDPSAPAGTTRWLLDDWVDKPSGATAVVSPVRHRWTYTDSDRNELFEILDAAGTAVHSVFKRFDDVNFGPEITRELAYDIVGYGGSAPVQTSYTYHTSTASPGSWRRVKSIASSDGSWTAFDYHDEFSSRGLVRQTRRPHGSGPVADPGFDSASGEVTTHTYAHLDNWGTRRLPTRIETKVNGFVTARSDFSYSEETVIDSSASYTNPDHRELPVVVVERRDYSEEGRFLTTRTRTYREDADPQFKFFPGLVRSVERPDKTMTVAVYFHADFNSTADPFAGSPTGLSRVHASLHGTHDTTTGTALPFYPVPSQAVPANFRLVTGKSTQSRTLLGEQGLPLASEQQVYLGNWLVTAQEFPTYTHSLFPLSTSRRSGAAGPTWTVSSHTWSGGRLSATTDDTGNRQSFDYDPLGRTRAVTRDGATAQDVLVPSLTTVQTFDAAGRVLSKVVSAGGESLVSTTTYDTAGRPISESSPGVGPTTHSYNIAGRTQTTTLPSGATRTETRLLDGRLTTVEGSAVVAEYQQYLVGTDGRRMSTVRPRSSGDNRFMEVTTDWLGRPIRRARPTVQMSLELGSMTYHPATGQLITSTLSERADQRYEYDSMGERNRTGLDLDGNGLVLHSSDRITDSATAVEEHGGRHWLTRRSWGYAIHGSDTRVLLGTTRQLVTGLSPTLRGETRTTDADGNESVRTVEVDAGNKLVTVTTTTPGLSRAATEVSLAGYTIAVTGHDGLTVKTSYDALGRPRAVTDPRTGTATTTYKLNTTLPEERRDGGGRLIATTTYDTSGRPIHAVNAAGHTIRTDYTPRGEVWRRWGSATAPVSYEYDNYGQRTHQRTYRADTTSFWEADKWPGDGVAAQTTEWQFDAITGLLHRKLDPAGNFVTYSYDSRGLLQSRQSARRRNGDFIATWYDYVPKTGEPLSITYSDGTPAVSFASADGVHYTRLGQPRRITDATGARQFTYDSTAPWRMTDEKLSSFYGNRTLAPIYETTTSTNLGSGGYGSHTLGSVKGRASGYRLGLNPGPSSFDLEVTCGASSGARVAGLVSRRGNGSVSRQFVYGYEPAASGLPTALVKSLSVVGHAFQITRNFAVDHDLPTAIDTLWSGVSQTRYDYTYNSLLQRQAFVQSGAAFGDLGTTHQRFTYGTRGELSSAYGYYGGDAASTSQPLAGRLYDYTYDAIGNRRSSNSSSDPVLRDDYTINDLNQISGRENNTLAVGGTASTHAAARIAVSGPAPLPLSGGQVIAGRQGRYWGTNLAVNNQTAPFVGPITAYGVIPGAGSGGTDLVRTETRSAFLPPGTQSFRYDEDGNLTSDGLWEYSWDAENRLSSMSATAAAIAAGRPPLTLVFRYDYRHRRIAKEVRTGATFTLLSERRYVYDGWNVIAELDGAAALKRSFTWGLDLNGGIGTAGGVGGLLQIHDVDQNKTLLPAFDASGNLTALFHADTGATEASYEYSPFGELLRAAGAYAPANPFRFSTKWQDDESGLLYYGYRYYAPREGRFINRDPIEEQGGLNLYGFCGNDGINHWDYLGQKSWLSKLWNKFRHTIISAALTAINPMLGTLYNTGVGARYGGAAGALLSFASSGRIPGQIGGALAVATQAYGLYSTFKDGKFLNNFGNWFLGSSLANASYQLADRVFNGPLSFPATIDMGGESAVAREHLTECIGQFRTRDEMTAYLTNDDNLDRYGSDFFLAERRDRVWSLYKVDGIHTKVVYANGIQGMLARHMSLGVGHLFKRFSNLEQFTIAHNRSHSALLDMLEAGGDLLGIPSKSALKLAAGLQSRLASGNAVHLVSHSQGFATTINALRIMGVRGVNAAGLTVYPHAGAGNSFHAGALATAIGASLKPHVFSSFDLVPGIVGMNGNPLQVLAGVFAAPSLLGSESKSQHTLPNENPEMPWLRWGPGN